MKQLRHGPFPNLKAEVARRGLTYAQVANLAGLTSAAYIYNMLSGHAPVSPRFMKVMSEKWDLDPAYLFSTEPSQGGS